MNRAEGRAEEPENGGRDTEGRDVTGRNARERALGAGDIERWLVHTGWVRGLVRQIVREASRREDVEQATWLAVIEGGPGVVGDVRAWLRRVVGNAARQGARGEARRERRERAVARPEALPSTAELVEQADLQRLVVRAVVELPEPLRSTLLLHYLHDVPTPEIARRQGVADSTVRNRLKEGRDRLRGRLEREPGDVTARRRALLLLLAPFRARRALSLPWIAAGLAGVGLVATAASLTRPRPPSSEPRALARAPETAAQEARPLRAPPAAETAAPGERTPVETEAPEPAFGRVVDVAGAPVADARVWPAAYGRFALEPRALGESFASAADGTYRLPERFVHPGLVLLVEKVGFAPELIDLEDGALVTLEPAGLLVAVVREAETGRPLAGVRVTAGEYDWAGGAMRETVTDARGAFTFARGPLGRSLDLRLATPGSAFQARRILLEQATTTAEFLLARGGELRGRVLASESWQPLAGAEIVFDFARTACTGPDGAFELAGITEESHDLEVRLPGRSPLALHLEAGADLPRAELELPLPRACVLTGSVRTADGAPVAHARVGLVQGKGAPSTDPLPEGARLGSELLGGVSVRCDGSGAYRLEDLPPWPAGSTVRASEPLTGRTLSVDLERAALPGTEMALDLVFPTGGPRLSGRVRRNGAALAARIHWRTAHLAGTLESDGDGHWELDDLEPGPLTLSVEIAGRGACLERTLVLGRDEDRREDLDLDLVLLEGTLVDSEGRPVAHRGVSGFASSGGLAGAGGESDDAGRFRLWLEGGPATPMTLLVDGETGPQVFDGLLPGTPELRFELAALGELRLELLVPAQDSPPTEVTVSFRRSGTEDFAELPRSALDPLGGGAWRVVLPQGRLDLRVEGGKAHAVLEGIEVGAKAGAVVAVDLAEVRR